MTKRYFSGPTEAQAVLEAATQFGLSPEEVAYESVSRKGSLRARTKSIIAVDDESPAKAAPSAPAAVPEAPAEVVSPPPATADEGSAGEAASSLKVASNPDVVEDPEESTVAEEVPPAPVAASDPGAEPADSAPAPPGSASGSKSESKSEPESKRGPRGDRKPRPSERPQVSELSEQERVDARARVIAAMESLLDLADLDVDPKVNLEVEPPVVDLSGPDREWLLDGEGDLLLALEHLVGRILYRAGCPVDRVRVDSGGYREAQDDALRERTRKALRESAESGRPVVFEPLSPAERRVIHLEVEASGSGRSRSEGGGYRRRVRIEAEVAGPEEASADTEATGDDASA